MANFAKNQDLEENHFKMVKKSKNEINNLNEKEQERKPIFNIRKVARRDNKYEPTLDELRAVERWKY